MHNGSLDVQTGSATPPKESSAKGEARQFCPLTRGKLAELLLNYRLQMKVYGCNWAVPNANKTLENRSVRIGQMGLANRSIQPLCHLSGASS
jgi:hypothetical protein